MLSFNATIKKFDAKGEKSGWSYINIPSALASQLKPGCKKSFTVKGKLDNHAFEGLSLLPMGEGNFILALNATIRKAIRKQNGAAVNVQMEVDENAYQLNKDLLECMQEDAKASAVFNALPNSHKSYYSKWVESAKTDATRAKRIAVVIRGMADGLDFGGMLRREREERQLLGR